MNIPLGLDFPTDWGRTPVARALRTLLQDAFIVPATKYASSLSVQGLENISRTDTMIFAANHVSHLDTPIILSALPADIRRHTVVAAAMDTFFMEAPKAVTTVLTFNAIPIERHKVNRRSAALAQRMLEEHWHLLIYPEGGRTTTGNLQEFKGGVAYLSERTGAPVIPTFVHGAGELLGPKYAKADVYTNAPSQSRHHVAVTFGTPLRLEEGENIRRFNLRIEEAVASLGRAETGDENYGVRGE